ncbi:GNAT family N-acetyltransferase [Humitalea rosea]|uniref:GNAT family N-acetyltransferase n=1 Tax=Humitalea rosea TaxID=990373 RepID=UPI001FE9B5B8|nr:GNAT family N-acetyltransferase [Humitalea rosea]
MTLPDDLDILANAARAEGFRALDVLAEEFASGTNRFDGPGEALFGAYRDGALVGIGGVCGDPYAPGAARVRRLYVAKAARGQGIGRALLAAMVARAAPHFPLLRVRAPEDAAGFYLATGFVALADPRGASHAKPLG